MKKILLLFILVSITIRVNAQNVGIGTNTPDTSAQLDVTSTTKGLLPPRMTTTQRNAIPMPAAGLVIYNTESMGFECYNGTAWYGTVHYMGEGYGGGIVFYIYDNGQHGLIAATADQSTGIHWHNELLRNTGSKGDGLNAGAMNTTMIVATQMTDNQTGNFAAKVCADYSVSVDGITYGDWYLPSKYELNLLYLQKNIVGGFADFHYWSSSEFEFDFEWAYDQNFSKGIQGPDIKEFLGHVRCVRTF